MNRKFILKYIFIYIPFLLGIGLFSFEIINLFSSLLLFLGGYIALKNTLDYRMVRKNKEKYKIDNDKEKNNYLDNREVVDTSKLKKRNIKVRKRKK